MVYREDIPHDRRLTDSITLTVSTINNRPKHPRDVELTGVDEAGDELHVIIWKTHNIEQQWVEGQTYEIDGARGKRYSTGDGVRVELHSTDRFQVREIDQTESTRLLVMGDTHVGYRHRSQSEKPSWAQDVNGREVFTRCLAQARNSKLDAVIHAGDIFDHHNTRGDRNQVGQEIHRTVESGTPFYYIYGNHEDKHGQRLLNSTPGIHLTEEQPLVGDCPVNLLGVDHSGHKFPDEAPEASMDKLLNPNIAVIHETPYPVVDGRNKTIYQNDSNEADISGFVDTARYNIDLFINGHLHVAKRAQVRGYDIPVLVTGPTIPISQYKKDSRPSTWLVIVNKDGIEINRQPL